MGKHSKKEEHQIIQLRDYQEPPLPPEDGPGEEGPDSGASITYEDGKGKKPAAVPKAVYRAAVILLVLVVALALWMNRTSLNPESIGSWLKLQITGAEIGDGFPVQITGSEVQEANFLAQGGNAVVLSDTVFSILNPTGREELSLRHSLNHPVLQEAGGRYLLYNSGSTGYMVLSGTDVTVSSVEERDILTGAIAQNGRFALGVQGANGASELKVYQKDGTLQYQYSLAWDYITAIALNFDGAYGVVCTVRSDKGILVSKVLVFDFMSEEPIV